METPSHASSSSGLAGPFRCFRCGPITLIDCMRATDSTLRLDCNLHIWRLNRSVVSHLSAHTPELSPAAAFVSACCTSSYACIRLADTTTFSSQVKHFTSGRSLPTRRYTWIRSYYVHVHHTDKFYHTSGSWLADPTYLYSDIVLRVVVHVHGLLDSLTD